MAVLDLKATMLGLAAAVETVQFEVTSGITFVSTAHPLPVQDANTGEAIVGYPRGDIALGITFQRGFDRATFPVWVIAGLAWEAETQEVLGELLGAGSNAIVDAIESAEGIGAVAVHVAVIETLLFRGDLAYVTVRFDADVIS